MSWHAKLWVFVSPGAPNRLGIVLILSKTGKVHLSPRKWIPDAASNASSRVGQFEVSSHSANPLDNKVYVTHLALFYAKNEAVDLEI